MTTASRTRWSSSPHTARAAGLALGYVLDAMLGDPRRGHPVAAFGRAAAWFERARYADSRGRGAAYLIGVVVPVLALGAAMERAGRERPARQVALTAAATWAVLGGRSLADEGRAMAALLADGRLPTARARLRNLCGRAADDLDDGELARAVVESLAENTADAVVASLCWGTVAGIPGLLGHRAVNTLDAMVGHRTERYARFGTAAARVDDAAAYLPARVTALLTCALAPVVGGSPRQAWTIMRRDGAAHPSPNGGRCEAAFAGALGVRLGGRNVYPGGRVEVRGTLGDGPRPTATDVRRAARLARAVAWAATALAVGVSAAVGVAGGARGGSGPAAAAIGGRP